MTDEQIKAALAARIWKAQIEDAGFPQSIIDGRTPEAFAEQSDDVREYCLKFAAAVFDLVKPKQLAWAAGRDYHLVWYCVNTQDNQYRLMHDDISNEYATLIDGSWHCRNTKELAQAAAQAHADAAHWGNTALADMIGGK